MKYKIDLGVMGTFIAFQGTMATADVGRKKSRDIYDSCANCHMGSGDAHRLAPEEIDAGAPEDKTHFSAAALAEIERATRGR